MKALAAFIAGSILGGLLTTLLPPTPHVVNLDQIPYIEYQWTVIELESIAHYRQFWTKDELRNLVTTVKAASEALKQGIQQADTPNTPASWPLQPSLARQ